MPFREKQKQKILHILKMFYEETDAVNRLTVQDITARLSDLGIPAERKGVYTDIEELQNFGINIACVTGRKNEYYLASRTFELAELKLLADSVRSARSLTRAKSGRLFEKLKGLAGPYAAAELGSAVSGGSKNGNEQIYCSLNTILRAIASGRKLCFKYFAYDFSKKPIYRNGGACYTVSPYDVLSSDGNSYLICHYPKYGAATFRIDRMEGVTVLAEKSVADRRSFDTDRYLSETFSMYSGRSVVVGLIAENSLLTVILDRFGRETGVRRVDDGHFAVSVRVAVSPMFIGWCCNFGSKLYVASPPEVVEEIKRTLSEIEKNY